MPSSTTSPTHSMMTQRDGFPRHANVGANEVNNADEEEGGDQPPSTFG